MVSANHPIAADGTEQETWTSTRRCPGCQEISPIEPQEPLWPIDWRCKACGASRQTRNGFVLLAPDLDEIDEGFEIESFAHLAKVENEHFWFVARNELVHWLVKRFAPSATRVIEIGCGTGFVLSALRSALPNATLAGGELHSAGLQFARKRHGPDLEFLQVDARDTGLNSAFDLVAAFDVLEHIPEDERVLGEIYRMLQPGGIFLATVPQHPWMWSAADDVAHHQRRYKMRELEKKVISAGLEPIYRTSFVVLPFPMMMISRLLERMRSRKASVEDLVESEFQVPGPLNKVLLALLRAEHGMRRLGLPMPFGGSQVVAARKAAT